MLSRENGAARPASENFQQDRHLAAPTLPAACRPPQAGREMPGWTHCHPASRLDDHGIHCPGQILLIVKETAKIVGWPKKSVWFFP